jgi:hypothetical protein
MFTFHTRYVKTALHIYTKHIQAWYSLHYITCENTSRLLIKQPSKSRSHLLQCYVQDMTYTDAYPHIIYISTTHAFAGNCRTHLDSRTIYI